MKNRTKKLTDFWIHFLLILPPFLDPFGHPLNAKIAQDGATLNGTTGLWRPLRAEGARGTSRPRKFLEIPPKFLEIPRTFLEIPPKILEILRKFVEILPKFLEISPANSKNRSQAFYPSGMSGLVGSRRGVKEFIIHGEGVWISCAFPCVREGKWPNRDKLNFMVTDHTNI